MSYADQYKSQLEHAANAIELTRKNPKFMMQHMQGGRRLLNALFGKIVASFFFHFPTFVGKIQMKDMFQTNGIGIHFFMFLTFLKSNGTKEQKEKWLDLAMEGRFMGCYAQTELGHGSNLRGLETIATFDKEVRNTNGRERGDISMLFDFKLFKCYLIGGADASRKEECEWSFSLHLTVQTDEFIIHSPTLTSLKWWPTGMYAWSTLTLTLNSHLTLNPHLTLTLSLNLTVTQLQP
jgi:hypothetical protein